METLLEKLKENALVMEHCATSLDVAMPCMLRDLKAQYVHAAQELVCELDAWTPRTLAHVALVDKTLDVAIEETGSMGALLGACIVLADSSAVATTSLHALTAASNVLPEEVVLPRWPLRRKWCTMTPTRMWIEPCELLQAGMIARVMLCMPCGADFQTARQAGARVLLRNKGGRTLDTLTAFHALWPDVWSVAFHVPVGIGGIYAEWIENGSDGAPALCAAERVCITPTKAPALALRTGVGNGVLPPLAQYAYKPDTDILLRRAVPWEHDVLRLHARYESGADKDVIFSQYTALQSAFFKEREVHAAAADIQAAAVSADGRWFALTVPVLSEQCMRINMHRLNVFEQAGSSIHNNPEYSISLPPQSTVRNIRYINNFDRKDPSKLPVLLVLLTQRTECPGHFSKMNHTMVLHNGVRMVFGMEVDGDALDADADDNHIVVVRGDGLRASRIDVYEYAFGPTRRVHTMAFMPVSRVFALDSGTFCCYNSFGSQLTVYVLKLHRKCVHISYRFVTSNTLFQYGGHKLKKHFFVTGTADARHFLINTIDPDGFEHSFVDAVLTGSGSEWAFSTPSSLACSGLFPRQIPVMMGATSLFMTTVVAGNVLCYAL
jgi:hypothetical protein